MKICLPRSVVAVQWESATDKIIQTAEHILLFHLILQSNSKCLSRSHKHHSGPQLWPQITTELELLHDSYLVPVSLSN